MNLSQLTKDREERYQVVKWFNEDFQTLQSMHRDEMAVLVAKRDQLLAEEIRVKENAEEVRRRSEAEILQLQREVAHYKIKVRDIENHEEYLRELQNYEWLRQKAEVAKVTRYEVEAANHRLRMQADKLRTRWAWQEKNYNPSIFRQYN